MAEGRVAIVTFLNSLPGGSLLRDLQATSLARFKALIQSQGEPDTPKAGALILQGLILKKFKKIKPNPGDSEQAKRLKKRLLYFKSPLFLHNFLIKFPVHDGIGSTDTSYTKWFDTLFNTLFDDWREDKLIKATNITQCTRAIGPESKVCYLCGHPFLKRQSTKECEHVLPVVSALSHLWLAKDRIESYTPEQQKALTLEYAWAHQCCNRIKTNVEFVKLNYPMEMYIVNHDTIGNYYTKLNSAGNHDCSKIPYPKPTGDCKTKLQDRIIKIVNIINMNIGELGDIDMYLLLMKYKILSAFTSETFLGALEGTGGETGVRVYDARKVEEAKRKNREYEQEILAAEDPATWKYRPRDRSLRTESERIIADTFNRVGTRGVLSGGQRGGGDENNGMSGLGGGAGSGGAGSAGAGSAGAGSGGAGSAEYEEQDNPKTHDFGDDANFDETLTVSKEFLRLIGLDEKGTGMAGEGAGEGMAEEGAGAGADTFNYKNFAKGIIDHILATTYEPTEEEIQEFLKEQEEQAILDIEEAEAVMRDQSKIETFLTRRGARAGRAGRAGGALGLENVAPVQTEAEKESGEMTHQQQLSLGGALRQESVGAQAEPEGMITRPNPSVNSLLSTYALIPQNRGLVHSQSTSSTSTARTIPLNSPSQRWAQGARAQGGIGSSPPKTVPRGRDFTRRANTFNGDKRFNPLNSSRSRQRQLTTELGGGAGGYNKKGGRRTRRRRLTRRKNTRR